MLKGFFGEESGLLFAPITLTQEQRTKLTQTMSTETNVFTIVATGIVGHSATSIESVVTFHDRWLPPPPNTGVMPGLGVFQYYRID